MSIFNERNLNMSILNEALNEAVEKYVRKQYQALILSNVSPILDTLLTPENVERFVKDIAGLCGAADTLAATWKAVSSELTDQQVIDAGHATLEDSAEMVNSNHESNIAFGVAVTNIFTGAALIALGVAKAAI